eukprot:scaffold927_cov375-Prasinococcus_capsulatus_cf.AAC.13
MHETAIYLALAALVALPASVLHGCKGFRLAAQTIHQQLLQTLLLQLTEVHAVRLAPAAALLLLLLARDDWIQLCVHTYLYLYLGQHVLKQNKIRAVVLQGLWREIPAFRHLGHCWTHHRNRVATTARMRAGAPGWAKQPQCNIR